MNKQHLLSINKHHIIALNNKLKLTALFLDYIEIKWVVTSIKCNTDSIRKEDNNCR